MLVPGLIGVFLTPIWRWAYKRTRKLPSMSADRAPKQAWGQIMRQRRTWALVLPRVVGDPLWYFCFFWIPIYLQQARHLDLRELAIVGWIPFLLPISAAS